MVVTPHICYHAGSQFISICLHWIRTSIEEEVDNFKVTIPTSYHECSPSIILLLFWIGTSLKEEVDNFGVTVLAR